MPLFDRSTRQPHPDRSQAQLLQQYTGSWGRPITVLWPKASRSSTSAAARQTPGVMGCIEQQFILSIWQEPAHQPPQSHRATPCQYGITARRPCMLRWGRSASPQRSLGSRISSSLGWTFCPLQGNRGVYARPGYPFTRYCSTGTAQHKVHTKVPAGMQWLHNLPGSSVYEDALVLTCKRASWILWTPMGSAPLVSGRTVLLLPAVSTAATPGVSPLDSQQGPLLFCDIARGGPQGLGLCEWQPGCTFMPGRNFWSASAITKAPVGSDPDGGLLDSRGVQLSLALFCSQLPLQRRLAQQQVLGYSGSNARSRFPPGGGV